MHTLEDKVAIITGGSQGLGKAIATTLAQNGATVIIADIKAEQARETANQLMEEGYKAKGVFVDVSEEKEVEDLLSKTKEKYGTLDIIINNAGVDKTKLITDLTVKEWDMVIDVNLRGPFLMTKYAFDIMQDQSTGGHIVNITSTAAKRAWAEASAYHASKWGLLGFSYASHVEGRAYNIKVTAVIAGGMKTPFLLERFPDIDTSTLQDPQNVADTIQFLLTRPAETVIPEIMVIPMKETSWP